MQTHIRMFLSDSLENADLVAVLFRCHFHHRSLDDLVSEGEMVELGCRVLLDVADSFI